MIEVISPVVPYISAVPKKFFIGNGVRIFGVVAGGYEARMFHVRLQCNDGLADAKDVAVDIAVSVQDGTARINSMRSGVWDDSQLIPSGPIRINQKFEVLIKCDISQYKIFINTCYYCGLPQRIPFDFITHIAIFGDALIDKICYEEEPLTIETPPPSYDEAQAQIYADQAYDGDLLLQPTPGRPPYPSDRNPLFGPVVNGNGVARSETYYYPYQTQTITHVPTTTLNAASPNFRPVKKCTIKETIHGIVVLIFIIILLGCISVAPSKSKHRAASSRGRHTQFNVTLLSIYQRTIKTLPTIPHLSNYDK